MQRTIATLAAWTFATALALGCGDDTSSGQEDAGDHHHHETFAHTLYVAHEGFLISYDVASGDEKPGALTNVEAPVDLLALDDGSLLVNLGSRNEALVVDGTTMLEIERVKTSEGDGKRPVHSYISPKIDGKQYYMALNDGLDDMLATNSAAFIDIVKGSETRFALLGEIALGNGHHKASFSTTQARVVISNIGDCDNALSVYDFSKIRAIEKLVTFSGANLGFDAAAPGMDAFNPAYCDVTYGQGLPPAPHGCATSPESGKAYCNITSSGALAVIDIDADPPTLEVVATAGSGGGFTVPHPGSRYLYSMQEGPREGDGGADCQIGQVVVIDSTTDTIASEVPLLYTGPDCDNTLAGTAAESANPGHSHFAQGGDTLFISTSGGFMNADARVDQLVVLDTSDPAKPKQLASIEVGVHTDHSSSALSGDGQALFVVHTIDGTVSMIDTETRKVVRTITVGDKPKTVATYGSAEGPSEQTGPIVQ